MQFKLSHFQEFNKIGAAYYVMPLRGYLFVVDKIQKHVIAPERATLFAIF